MKLFCVGLQSRTDESICFSNPKSLTLLIFSVVNILSSFPSSRIIFLADGEIIKIILRENRNSEIT
jgi:hypothetical protein